MSFLLDALGKADHERRRSEVPELRSHQHTHRATWYGLLRGIALLSLLAMAFAAGYASRPYFDSMGSDAPAQPLRSADNKPVSPTDSASPVATPAGDAQPVSEPSSAGLVLDVISYSRTPASRFAMINGVLLREGEGLDSGETLLEIEANAVVLEKGGKQIRIGL